VKNRVVEENKVNKIQKIK